MSVLIKTNAGLNTPRGHQYQRHNNYIPTALISTPLARATQISYLTQLRRRFYGDISISIQQSCVIVVIISLLAHITRQSIHHSPHHMLVIHHHRLHLFTPNRKLTSYTSFFPGHHSPTACRVSISTWYRTLFTFLSVVDWQQAERHYVSGLFVRCPSVHTYFTWHDIFVLNGRISMKLAANIRHVIGHWWLVEYGLTSTWHITGHWWQGFQGQMSDVMVMARPVSLVLLPLRG